MVLALEREPRQRRQWGRLVARAWDDDGFRQRLLAEPEAVLREEGIDVPEGVEVRVEEEGSTPGAGAAYLRLPARPGADDLVEDDLSLPEHSAAIRNGGATGGRCACLCKCKSKRAT